MSAGSPSVNDLRMIHRRITGPEKLPTAIAALLIVVAIGLGQAWRPLP
jgi:hypothetical protein